MPSYPVERLVQERAQIFASLQKEFGAREQALKRTAAKEWPTPQRLPAWQRKTRAELKRALGWPLVGGATPKAKARWENFAEDELGTIWLVRFGVTGGYATYALLFLPRDAKVTSLVIAQHGGLGIVERFAGLGESSKNYNDLVARLRRRGAAVLAPQLPMWGHHAEPRFSMDQTDPRLRLLGGSFPALNVLTLQRALDAALALPALRGAHVTLVGVSYGGCFGLFAGALDPRIAGVLTSVYFNDRHRYPQLAGLPLTLSAGFLDAELAALMCPRRLWIEVADGDELFTPEGAKREAAKVAKLYRAAGHARRFHFEVFSGPHEFNRSDEGIEWILGKGEK